MFGVRAKFVVIVLLGPQALTKKPASDIVGSPRPPLPNSAENAGRPLLATVLAELPARHDVRFTELIVQNCEMPAFRFWVN